MRVVTVLKSGPEYSQKHVIWLAKQIEEHSPGMQIVCLTDTELNHPLIESIPLRHGWPGWWSKLELFSDLLDGDVFYLDIDTVVRGPLYSLIEVENTTFLRDFYHHSQFASGVMYIKQEDKAKVWERFIESPELHIRNNKTRLHWGDQGFYRRVLPVVDLWQRVKPGQIFSYKVHCKNTTPPDGAALVCFHGNPRPWAAGCEWVPKL